MRTRSTLAKTAALLVTMVIASACSSSDATHPMDDAGAMTHDDGHTTPSMMMDTTMMRRHSQDMDTAFSGMRSHIAALRAATPAQWHDGMADHVTRVVGLLAMIDRHMGEMGGHGDGHAGMNMTHHGSDGHGMTGGKDHDRVMAGMKELRAEAAALQTATPAALQAMMPAHLERLDSFIELMAAQHAAHHS
jgi:hypothetical protein